MIEKEKRMNRERLIRELRYIQNRAGTLLIPRKFNPTWPPDICAKWFCNYCITHFDTDKPLVKILRNLATELYLRCGWVVAD